MPPRYKLRNIQTMQEFPIDGTVNIGRSSDNDIVIDSIMASRYHTRIDFSDEKLLVKDLNSTNGTFVNSVRITQPTEVVEGCLLGIGESQFRLESIKQQPADQTIIQTTEHTVIQTAAQNEPPSLPNKVKSILGQSRFKSRILSCALIDKNTGERHNLAPNSVSTIGRLDLNDIVINDNSVSRHHAIIEVREYSVVVTDINSANGTFVNNERIQSKNLLNGDYLHIGGLFCFQVYVDSDETSCLSSLLTIQNSRLVDIQQDAGQLLEVLRESYGEQVLLEVERQTMIFCDEFEKIAEEKGENLLSQTMINRFIKLITNCDAVNEPQHMAEPLRDLIARTKDEAKHYSIILFENQSNQGNDDIISNGLLIRFANGSQLVATNIPFSNILYVIYATNWLTRVK